MRTLLLLFFLAGTLFGFAESVRSLSADFTQTITDDTNTTITYTGHLDAVRPDMAVWRYTSPVEKSVYVIGHRVTIVEPELEQAIQKSFREEIDLFKILSKAKKIDGDTYLATHKTQQFVVKIKDDILMAISFKDAIENRIRIQFSDQKLNRPLPEELFIPVIPEGYDVLSE